jgi:hypothetical protein
LPIDVYPQHDDPSDLTRNGMSSSTPTRNKSRVPHIPDFLWSLMGLANFMRLSFKERRTRGPVQCCVQEIRGISLVFREMWDTTALNPNL